MGYFPNGTSGMCYEEEFCAKCLHSGADGVSCNVMLIHNLYNYQQCKETPEGKAVEAILDLLIPRTKDGLWNEKCSMFARKNGVTEKHLRDWAKYKAIMAEASPTPHDGGQ